MVCDFIMAWHGMAWHVMRGVEGRLGCGDKESYEGRGRFNEEVGVLTGEKIGVWGSCF
ncbi:MULTISPECIES: hypothetical protein [unclassified Bartonella]|uniref:hypothetical protein n=1 Tax=unclassified Bartonella TaxID=2645622 RepID=UPI0035D03D9D